MLVPTSVLEAVSVALFPPFATACSGTLSGSAWPSGWGTSKQSRSFESASALGYGLDRFRDPMW